MAMHFFKENRTVVLDIPIEMKGILIARLPKKIRGPMMEAMANLIKDKQSLNSYLCKEAAIGAVVNTLITSLFNYNTRQNKRKKSKLRTKLKVLRSK